MTQTLQQPGHILSWRKENIKLYRSLIQHHVVRVRVGRVGGIAAHIMNNVIVLTIFGFKPWHIDS